MRNRHLRGMRFLHGEGYSFAWYAVKLEEQGERLGASPEEIEKVIAIYRRIWAA